MQLDHLAQAAMDAARKAGARDADILVVRNESTSVDVLDGQLEHAERSESTDVGIRVLMGTRQACVATSDLSPAALALAAERAVAMAQEAPEDPTAGLADRAQLAHERGAEFLDLVDHHPAPAPATLQDLALRAEAAALGVAGVSKVQSASAAHGRTDLYLAATNGFHGGYGRTGTTVSAVAIAGEGLGMERDHAVESRTHAADLPEPEEIGRLAGERAVALVGPRRPPTGAWPVMFDERVASSLIGHLLGAINGTAIARGASWLRDAMDQAVLPPVMDLIEDPHRARIAGSRPFDAEGLPTRRRTLVEGGVLKSWILDLATARKLGLQSTANARRGTTAPPSPGVTNVALTLGNHSREELIAAMGTGLIVTSMIGSTINPTTGDYSRGASGFWVENGEITGPVNEFTIAGNLRQMLRNMIAANDVKPHKSHLVPSLLVEGLTIAGE